VIRKVVCVESACYTHLEEERLVTAVLAILRRDLLREMEIHQWIEGFSERGSTVKSAPERHILRSNIKNFLQSLYFRLQWEGMTDKFDSAINRTLRSINPFARQEGS
jgi:hypothetical protein